MANETVSIEDLRRLFKKAAINANVYEGKPALLGRSNGALYFDSTSRDRVWVRLGEGDNQIEIVARIGSTPRQINLPVIVADRNGEPTVIREDSDRAATFTGGVPFGVIEHAANHGRFGSDALYITGPAFLPLMSRPSSPPAMTVTVESGFYRYQGIEKAFAQTVSGSFSSYVPPPTRQTFVVLYLNRATNALGITASGGSIVSSASIAPFTVADVLAVVGTLNDAYFPIAAIRLFAGQTRIVAQDIFMDLRLWGGELAGGGPVTASWYDYTLGDPVNGLDFNVDGVYPAGWNENFSANPSVIADGFWKLYATASELEIGYNLQTAFDLESLGKFVSFGPIIISDNHPAEDLTWYFELHSNDSSVYNVLIYARIALNWDSVGLVWQVRIEGNEGGGLTPPGDWFVLPGPPLNQPLWFTIWADSPRLFTGYVGNTPLVAGQMDMGLIDLTATDPWGEFWLEVGMLRPSATGPSYLWIGGIDYD